MYRYILTDFGKSVYKGGNIEVMNETLKKVFKSELEADKWMFKIGSGNKYLFILKKISLRGEHFNKIIIDETIKKGKIEHKIKEVIK